MDQLHSELRKLHEKIDNLKTEHQKTVKHLTNKIFKLEMALAKKTSELLEEEQLKNDLLRQT